MEQVSVVGLDLTKSVFQVHGINAQGEAVLRRGLTRAQLMKLFEKLPPCLVGMESCASVHHWARELTALGHEVKLMPPQYVKPYVKRGKNDAADAQAICEPVTRPTMRFVGAKSPDQHATMMLHRVVCSRASGAVAQYRQYRQQPHADLHDLRAAPSPAWQGAGNSGGGHSRR